MPPDNALRRFTEKWSLLRISEMKYSIWHPLCFHMEPLLTSKSLSFSLFLSHEDIKVHHNFISLADIHERTPSFKAAHSLQVEGGQHRQVSAQLLHHSRYLVIICSNNFLNILFNNNLVLSFNKEGRCRLQKNKSCMKYPLNSRQMFFNRFVLHII